MYLLCKRLIDFSVALIAIVVLALPLLCVCLLVRFKLGSPIFFKQERPGKNGKAFTLVKFRTMTDAKDSEGDLLSDAERLTSFGKFLRSSSLDELPELWNILQGNMSLVGPRPLLTRYLKRYTLEKSRRHEAKPGLTGWAQINGRNALSWDDKFKLDVWYVDNASLILDCKILFLTFWKVLRREGISAQGEATMPEFTGKE